MFFKAINNSAVICLSILFFSVTSHSFSRTDTLRLDTVESLDLARYTGLWFEIASIPQSFSKDCLKNTTAQYEALSDGLIKVLNSCEEADQKINVAEGRARINQDFNTNSKLQVTFVKLIDWVWSFSGDYWVIKLDDNYQWSVVGHPTLDYLWILSRQPTLDTNTFKEIRDFITSVGYDSCKILITGHDTSPLEASQKHCDLRF